MSDSTHAGPAQASDPRQHLAQQSPRDELLPCQWTGCAERCQTAEQLYDHVCERHVGRKSTNNLNLTCGWGTCRTATVKRDHITSHIRVHVPLKPHRCDFCGKSFKRPQDLKKHVKTHADDSVLLRTPEPPHRSQNQEPGYRVENGKVITDLQALAATATGYYENPAPQGNVVNHGYGHQGPSTHNGYYGSQQPPYGPVYYAVNQGDGSRNPAFDSRKRGYEILDNFLGDVKRRQFDPTSSVEVGQRLFALQGLQLPEDGLMTDYQTAPAMVQADGHGSESQHQYALPPMHNLRTKNELMHIDQFLEQMQATVYESSNQAAAAGVAQPGAVFVSGGVNYEQGHSPPHGHSISSHAEAQPPTTDATSAAPLTADSSHSGTPALTPPSRSLSYTSAHSPPPAATTQGISPVSRANYPNLPSMGSSGNTLTNALGSNFDDQPRRYSGGMLQKASRAPGDVDMARSEEPESPEPRSSDIRNLHISTSLIDPVLAELSLPGQASADGDSAADTAQEMWVQNIRVVETLRKLIAEKLERLDYEDSDDDMADVKGDDESKANSVRDGRSRPLAEAVREKSEADKDAENLYPILRAVEAAS